MDIYIIAAMVKFLQARGQRRCTGPTMALSHLSHIQPTHGKCERNIKGNCHDIVFISIDFIYVVFIQVQFFGDMCRFDCLLHDLNHKLLCVSASRSHGSANVTTTGLVKS